MKKHSILTTKILIGFVLLALLMCGIGTAVGYVQYRKYIQKQYNNTAYKVAEVFKNYMSAEEMEHYISLAQACKKGTVTRETIEAQKQSERYQQIDKQLQSLRTDMEANDIYLAYLDMDELTNFDGSTQNWQPMTYIFDSYIEPDKVFSFGDMGGINPEFAKDALKVAQTGKRSDNYFISYSEYGYNTSAILPIVKDGVTVAVIGVEIPMATLQSALRDYLIRAVIAMAIAAFLCQMFLVNYLYRNMVVPINVISREARRFVEEENKISTELEGIKTKDEIQTLSENLLKMEKDINSYIHNLTRITAEKERIGAELNVATQIQADMLPSIFPAFPEREEFDIYASMNPAKEVGGDFYDFFLIDNDHLAMVVGDVSGKGVPAALFMVIAKTLIKNQALMGKMPDKILESVNNQLCENNKADMFVTVWLGIFNLTNGIITAASAGHEYPLVRHGSREYEYLEDPHGLPLGIMEGMEYEEYQIQMEYGDSIFVYSDGATDAVDNKELQFGEDRLKDTVNEHKDASPTDLLVYTKQVIDSFAQDAAQFDDITMLCMKYGKIKK